MAEIKPSFIRQPLTLVRERDNSLSFAFYETYDKKTGQGTPMDLSVFEFRCEFKYQVSDTSPIFSLSSEGLTPGILVAAGVVTLEITRELTEPIPVPNTAKTEFPFVKMVGELLAMDIETGKWHSALFFVTNLFERIVEPE